MAGARKGHFTVTKDTIFIGRPMKVGALSTASATIAAAMEIVTGCVKSVGSVAEAEAEEVKEWSGRGRGDDGPELKFRRIASSGSAEEQWTCRGGTFGQSR